MDYMYFMLIIIAVAGVIFVLYAGFSKSGGKSETNAAGVDYSRIDNRIDNKIRDVDESILNADSVITELNDVSQNVVKEINDKYQELLFLYNLIDEKKKKLAEAESVAVGAAVENKIEKPAQTSGGARGDSSARNANAGTIAAIFKNPKLNDILKLSSEGLSVSEIAKKLGLGQGEVELILSLDTASKNA